MIVAIIQKKLAMYLFVTLFELNIPKIKAQINPKKVPTIAIIIVSNIKYTTEKGIELPFQPVVVNKELQEILNISLICCHVSLIWALFARTKSICEKL